MSVNDPERTNSSFRMKLISFCLFPYVQFSDVCFVVNYGSIMMRRSVSRLTRPVSPPMATVLIVLGAICFGMVPWFAKNLVNADLPSVAVVFSRYAVSAFVLLPFLNLSKTKRGVTVWAMGAGLALSLGWIGYVEAIKDTPVSTVGVIYMTYPLFTLIMAWILFSQFPTARSIMAGFLILVAAGMALYPSIEAPERLYSLLIAFTAPVSFACAVCIIADKLTDLRPLARSAGVLLGASLGLLPMVVTLDAGLIGPVLISNWTHVLGISLVAGLIPNILFSIAAPVIGSARAAMAGSMELPTMFVVGWLAFGEELNFLTVLAGALVLAAILITPSVSPKPIERDSSER